jgi:hypothetical protein
VGFIPRRQTKEKEKKEKGRLLVQEALVVVVPS